MDEGERRTAVAVIGLGRMGRAMAERLVQQGADVTVWNRTASVSEELARVTTVRVAGTAREAAASADLVLQSLADDAAVLAAAAGPDGVVAGLRSDAVLIETSTVDPGTIASLAGAIAETGAAIVDAPVSGSVPAVAAGTLMIMAGGDAAALERARPVLAMLGDRIFHLGPSGAGAAMKLAVNGVVHALNIGLSEALVLAERCEVDRSTAWDVFAASVAGAPFVSYKRAAFLDPESTPPAFSLDLVAKDLRLIAGLAERLGLDAVQVRTNAAIAARVCDRGDGARDMSWVAESLRSSRRDD